MVLLTMTPSIVEALKDLPDRPEDGGKDDAPGLQTSQAEPPSLAEPAVGKPISHGQIMDLWKSLKSPEPSPTHSLEQLLRGAYVYVPPPPPKPEPTPEYKALMARLRRDEEARSYERMLNPPHVESFYERFPHASARAFAAVNQPSTVADTGDDDDGITYNDVNRQVLLIMNFLLSIIGVTATLWVAAKWWSLPARLFLTMGGAAIVAVAEVVVYSVYVWKMGDAKARQEAVKEMKEVVDTWVVGEGEKGEDEKTTLVESKDEDTDGVRKRTATTKEED